MKKKSVVYTLLMVLLIMIGCKPKNFMDDLPTLEANTNADVVAAMNPRAVVDAEDPNMVHFIMDVAEGWVAVWTIGTKRYTQQCVDRRFEFAGNYTVEAAAYNKNGMAPGVEVHFTIDAMDETVCENELYTALTGGCDADEGKTWMLSEETGYYGLIDIKTWIIEYATDYWWAAERGSHNGVYDDRITFVLNAEKTYRHITNGTSGLDSNEFECADYTESWEILTPMDTKDGRYHLLLTGDGFLPPIPSECQGQHDYTILTLNDSVLMTKIYKEGSNQAWIHKFVPAK